MTTTINVLDSAKAEKLNLLGFTCTVQRVSDDKQVYVFINTPELMKVLTEKFSKQDYYIGKTLNF